MIVSVVVVSYVAPITAAQTSKMDRPVRIIHIAIVDIVIHGMALMPTPVLLEKMVSTAEVIQTVKVARVI